MSIELVPTHIKTTRTGRVFLSQIEGEVREVWFVLHGYGQLADEFLQLFESVAANTRLLIAPEGLSRYYLRAGKPKVGASWMTRHDRQSEINDYVEYLDSVANAVFLDLDRSLVRVRVLGFSQGASTAYRWATLGEWRPDHLIAWGGDIPPELNMASLASLVNEGCKLTIVSGDDDQFYTSAKLLSDVERLDEALIRKEVIRFDGKHRLDSSTLVSLAESEL